MRRLKNAALPVLLLVSIAMAPGSLCGQSPPTRVKPQVVVGLDKYRLARGPTKIGSLENASGLTYCSETKSLFMVLNRPCYVIELALDGTLMRSIRLKDFNDTEGIVHAGGFTFYIAEERRGNICRINIGRRTRRIEYSDRKVLKLHLEPAANNKGLEGLAYDRERQRLFSVKEKRPLKLYQIAAPKASAKKSGIIKFENPWDLDKSDLHLKDVSAVHYHAPSGHLLILSDESRCLVETTLDGKEISRLKLDRGSAGLTEKVPQGEGITMDDEGNIYICSEPNLLYMFKKR
ncbi:MAG: SdiA-regulated domain-containing protein [Planctomycetes bacterium]|nr:SdiA-regulated domain-containing protein [Planctomycetota bacterium]